jgi:uncharacterized protein
MSTIPLPKNSFIDPRSEQSLIAAMLQPAFYPKPPTAVTHRETHISHVFIAGDLVYKVKKPVRFSFLDFSTLAKRRHYLQEELRLNQRLSPSVYLGVMPIAFDESGWRLGGWAEPAEYTLVMRRLPDKRMLPFLLETKQITPEMIAELAKLLASFHNAADIVGGIEPRAYVADVKKRWSDNLAELEPFLTNSEDRAACQLIRNFGAEFLANRADLFARRVSGGWIRDVHGDLHAEHICFAPEGIQIFDCIEFSRELRCCDLAAEIGFLLMDLAVRGGEFLIEPFLRTYRDRVNDAALTELLPFYQCDRALVRAKVHALRSHQWNEESARYFQAARRLTWEPMKPFLVMVCGLTGSGKSTLARSLAERLGLTVISSDVVRKRLAGRPGRHRVLFNEGIYSLTMTEKTYARMAREAENHIVKGQGAILDATFTRRAQREKMVYLADKHQTPLLVIHCAASAPTTQKRLSRRAAEGTDISDGRWDIYLVQKSADEPLDEIPASRRLELNTESAPEELASACESFLRVRLGQSHAEDPALQPNL